MGTKDMDFVQLNHLIGRKAGGIHIYPFVSSKNGKNSDLCAHIIVRGKALPEQMEDLFNLINCILQEFEFREKQRFKQFVAQRRAEMEAQIKGNCSSIAATRINAKLNVAGWINEQLSGISYLEFLQDLEKKIDDDWDKISILLEEIRKSLLSRKGFTINMTSDEENLAAAMKYLSKFVDSLPTTFPGKPYFLLEMKQLSFPHRLTMLGKLLTYMRVDISSMEVYMSYLSMSTQHGYGIVLELAVVHMEEDVILMLFPAIFTAGYKAVLHIHSIVEECEIVELIEEIDMKRKKEADPKKKKPKRKPLFVKNGAVVVCCIQVNNLICIENFSDFPQLGRFTLRTEGTLPLILSPVTSLRASTP